MVNGSGKGQTQIIIALSQPKETFTAIKTELGQTRDMILSSDPGEVGEGLGKATVFVADLIAGTKGGAKVGKLARVGDDIVSTSTKTVDDLIKGSTVAPRKPKGRSTLWDRGGGGFSQASKDFDAMKPNNVRDIEGGKVGTLDDGRTVNVRNTSSDGRATLEVKSGKNKTKFRYDDQ